MDLQEAAILCDFINNEYEREAHIPFIVESIDTIVNYHYDIPYSRGYFSPYLLKDANFCSYQAMFD